MEDRIFNGFVALIRERKKLVRACDVATSLGFSPQEVASVCHRLVRAGRMAKLDTHGRHPLYVPRVVK